MEADWEFQVGGDAPVIEAYWSGFVDLRAHPERVPELIECCELPALADVLIRLNSANSPAWTSKTDIFTPDHIDLDEMHATAESAVHAIACYIDLLRADSIWHLPSNMERDCKEICAELRTSVLRCCRIDIVVRKALVADIDHLGATVYFTACGPTLADAKNRLGECLVTFTQAMVSRPQEKTG
mgnify:CR=1 FL=1|jgi:hypothetical protein